MPTPHISAPDGAFAEAVLLPGDPLRAKYVAETFLDGAEHVAAEAEDGGRVALERDLERGLGAEDLRRGRVLERHAAARMADRDTAHEGPRGFDRAVDAAEVDHCAPPAGGDALHLDQRPGRTVILSRHREHPHLDFTFP